VRKIRAEFFRGNGCDIFPAIPAVKISLDITWLFCQIAK